MLLREVSDHSFGIQALVFLVSQQVQQCIAHDTQVKLVSVVFVSDELVKKPVVGREQFKFHVAVSLYLSRFLEQVYVGLCVAFKIQVDVVEKHTSKTCLLVVGHHHNGLLDSSRAVNPDGRISVDRLLLDYGNRGFILLLIVVGLFII